MESPKISAEDAERIATKQVVRLLEQEYGADHVRWYYTCDGVTLDVKTLTEWGAVHRQYQVRIRAYRERGFFKRGMIWRLKIQVDPDTGMVTGYTTIERKTF